MNTRPPHLVPGRWLKQRCRRISAHKAFNKIRMRFHYGCCCIRRNACIPHAERPLLRSGHSQALAHTRIQHENLISKFLVGKFLHSTLDYTNFSILLSNSYLVIRSTDFPLNVFDFALNSRKDFLLLPSPLIFAPSIHAISQTEIVAFVLQLRHDMIVQWVSFEISISFLSLSLCDGMQDMIRTS